MRRNILTVKEKFEFEAGGSLEGFDIVYHTSDREYRDSDTVVWICHALTGDSDPEDWWPQMVGKACLVNPDKYYVVCVNMLCSPYGSASPASIDPDTGRPFFFDFPRTTVRDMVNANILVRKQLGIEKIDMMIGPSIGGFQAVEWAIMEPERIEELIFIASDIRIPPYMTALNESQRMALEADHSFREAASLKGGAAGLACARSMALTSYRSYDGYNLTQAESSDDCLFADRACSYQRYQGKKLVDRFDAYCYYYLTYALDSHNVGRGRGGVEAALSTIKAKTLIMGIDGDVIFPVATMNRIHESIPASEIVFITSRFGHDGFLIENDQLTAILSPMLEKYDR